MTAEAFIEQLSSFQTESEMDKLDKYFRGDDPETKALGVKFKLIFETAKAFAKMPIEEIDKLLDNPYYEVRMGAVSIMDYQTREKKLSEGDRKALYDLYLRRHDRINNWDLVDRAAYNVLGRYLEDKPRDILYQLAHSANVWERRTAIVSTYHFIKQGEIEDTFNIAAILVNDEHDLINKAVGSWIREAAKKDTQRLIQFLDQYAATMPRVTLRYAIENLNEQQKKHYLGAK